MASLWYRNGHWSLLVWFFCLSTRYSLVPISQFSTGNYNESCASRSCNKDLNMKCIDMICTCNSDQYFTNKCLSKKSYLERCNVNRECKENAGLGCYDAYCKCDNYHYWDGTKCVSRKIYKIFCKGDQCLSINMLYCDSSYGQCLCDKTR